MILDELFDEIDELPEGVTYHDGTHTYRYNGAVVPGVTTILSEVGVVSFDGVPAATLKNAADRGDAIHRACCLVDKGTLDRDSTDVRLLPYIAAYEQFLADTGFKIACSERVIFSRRWRFCGRFDRWGKLFGKDVILDIKSGANKRGYQLQTAAYRIGAQESWGFQSDARYLVLLQSNRTYKLVLHDDPQDEGIFLQALSLYNWMRSK